MAHRLRHPPSQATSSEPALPPIISQTEQNNLPPIRHQSTPSHEPPREGSQDHSQSYNNHNRSGHATPSVVGRPYPPHDRTPTTPSVPQPFAAPAPPPGPDGAQPPPPPPHMMDHGAHHNGYPPNNVVPMGMPAPHGAPPGPPPPQPPGPHAPPPHHEGPPAYMTPMMDHHGQYGQGAMYGAPNYGPASGNMYNAQKRKQMRATQACEQCRQRKQKCDEGNPCSFCKENALACQYRDTPPAKTDKNMEKLLSYMEQHQSGLAELTAKIESFDRRLNRVEQNNGGAAAFPPELDPDALREQEEEAKRKSNLGDHRTAPHKLLLLWPSVRPLLSEAGIKFNDGYVMEAEDRGMLRLWTVGEAADEFDGTQGGGPASPARSDESGEGGLIPTPSAEGRWGAAMSTTSPEIRTSEAASSTMGGRKSNGELDLDANTINTLYESYMRHMHIMHPFLDKRRLRRMVDNFIRRYATGRSRATFAVGNSALDADTRPMKRQRSNGSTAIPVGEPEYRREVREPIERSPGNAVILLVLALGRICLHKDPLPGPVQSSKLQTNSVISHSLGMRVPGNTNTSFSASSPGSAVDIKPSPMSPLSTPHTQPTPPSENGYRFDPRSRRASTDAAQAGGDPRKNMDVLPGLAYYAKAAEILGEQGDGNDLVHAQMFLLAGLYKGQLARVRESMSWITMAGRAILTLLDRYKLYNDNYWTAYGDVRKLHERGQARIKDTRQALIVLASWTALQLETDILAEMKLPPSGIQSIEQLLLMPHKSPEDESYAGLEPDGSPDDYDNILMYYCAQLFLRRRLNKAHTEIYGPDCMDQPLSQVQEMLKGHEAILAGWRESLPVGLRWNDDDPPPSEILPARLRAKYWGARYVINRPFLDYALHIMPHVKDDTHTVEAAAKDAHGNPRDRADIHLFKAIQQMGDSEIWQAAKRCIDAAMHSTVAFDGMPDRLIVTNIHGTAHAQFGNMLVLSATMHTHYLKTLVDHGKFKKLLLRTIKFLRRLAPISPTCQADCLILEKFNNTLFPGSQEEPGTYRNQGYENDGALAAVAGPATL